MLVGREALIELVYELVTKAPARNPTFTGTPRAPTADADNSSDQIATTKFVHDLVEASRSQGSANQNPNGESFVNETRVRAIVEEESSNTKALISDTTTRTLNALSQVILDQVRREIAQSEDKMRAEFKQMLDDIGLASHEELVAPSNPQIKVDTSSLPPTVGLAYHNKIEE